MATRISVSVKGLVGLDDPGRMIEELEAATGLSWRQEPVEEKTLGAFTEIVLGAMVSKAAEMALQGVVDQVVRRWRRERLDPPEISVHTESVPDGEADRPAGSELPGD